MTSLEINSIKSEPLKKIADEIDASGVSNQDGKIDDAEFSIFKTMAEQLLNNGVILEDDYTAIFGLERTQESKVNVNVQDVQEKKNIEKTDSSEKVNETKDQSKAEKISKLEKDIAEMEEKLYKGKVKDSDFSERTHRCIQRGEVLGMFGGLAAGMFVGGGVVEELLLAVVSSVGVGVLGLCIGGLVGMLGGFIVSRCIKAHHKHSIKKCEQENPELYQALQNAKIELEKLKACD